MLEKHQKNNEEAIKILKRQQKYDKLAHAYLFVANDGKYLTEVAKDFTKEILGTDLQVRIEKETLLDVKRIYTDKMVIGKEEIKELQKFLNDKPLESDKKVYIIEEVDKMSNAAANALLKDLEEPREDVLAILTTTNIDKVLATIKSRCSVLYFANIEQENKEIYEVAQKFVEKIERDLAETYTYLEELVFQQIKEKNEMAAFFSAIINIYNEKLRNEIKNKKRSKEIMTKIKIYMRMRQLIFLNVNVKLIFDKLFYLLKEAKDEEYRWC